MPLPFSLLCELLEASLESYTKKKRKNGPNVTEWFTRHRGLIDAHDTSISALLSCLLPETRTDRVYCIQVASLERIVGRALMLGSSRMTELASYKLPGRKEDLADCVERVLHSTVSDKSIVGSVFDTKESDSQTPKHPRQTG
jgi:DNA ligase 4